MNCPNCGAQNPLNAAFCARCSANLYAQPGMPPPGMGQPGMGQPGMQPGMMQPGMMPPGMMQPGMMQPGMMPPGMMPPGMMMQPRTSGMAIAGFILSFLCGILGLIFSIMGYNEVKRSNGMVKGGGLAVAGIIISCVGILINILVLATRRGHY